MTCAGSLAQLYCVCLVVALENHRLGARDSGHAECMLVCSSIFSPPWIDKRQITHLICARLKYDLYDFFRGCFWAFYTRKRKEAGPKHPLKKSYRSYFRRAQIR